MERKIKWKTLSTLVSMLLVLSIILGMIPAYALTGIVVTAEVEDDGVVWIDTDGNQMTPEEKARWSFSYNSLKYTGEFIDGRIIGNMPATINGKPVTNLSTTFQGCTQMVEAPTLPSTATDLSSTFNGCTSLVTAPEIPASVTTMASAFNGCTSLVNTPVIPAGVTSLNYVFKGCTSLVEVTSIPSNVTSMVRTFENCTSLQTVPAIPGTVKQLDTTFKGCTSLKVAPVIEEGVTDLNWAFYGCTSLVNPPVIPEGVTEMTNTFRDCTSLVNPPVIPEGVTEMTNTFRDCTSLVKAPAIPDSVKNLTNTFMGCSSLKEASTIGSGVTNMSSTFQNCSSLVNPPVLPEGVENLSNTFNGCTSLTNISNIPESATNVGNMFYACQQLYGKVEIPEKYKDSKSLFAGCVPTLTITATNYNTGKTLQNVWIKFNMVYYDQGLTDENGQITFKGAQNLPEGSCILKFMYGGIVKNQEFTFTLNENAELNVTFGGPGEVLADNKIFGTITNSSIPISNAEVHVSNSTDGDIAIVHTNMDGSYEVPNLPNEDYVVKVTYRNTVGQEETTIADADQQVDIDLDIPEETYKLTGTVTNKDSGEPIEGIYIIVTDDVDNEIGSIYSEEDGTYEIGNLPNGTYKVYINDISEEDLVTDSLVIKDKDEVLNIQVEVPGTKEIKITWDFNGYTDKYGNTSSESKLILNEDETEVNVTRTPFDRATWAGHRFLGWFTQATGGEKVTAETTASADVTYYAHWEDCETHKISGTVTINCERKITGNWQGQEITDELWLQNFYVALIDKNNYNGGEFDWYQYNLNLTVDNRTGTYEFNDLPDGDYTIAIWNLITCDNPQSKDATVDGEDVVVDFIIDDGTYTITGTVTNKNTKDPIPGVEVKIKNEDGDIVGTTTTGKDGSYELPDLPNGDYTIIATYTDPTGTIEDIVKEVAVTIENSDKQVDIELELPNNHKVTGTIIDSNTKNPLPDVEVKLVDKDGKEIIVVKTGEDGTYEIPNLPDGDYKLIVTYKDPDGDPGQDITKEVEVTINGADEEVNIELPIPRRFKISGTVTWKLTGKPVALADIELKDEAGNTLKTVQTDNQGYYEFIGLTEGTYKVLATYKGSGEGIEAIIIDTKKEGED